MMNIFKRMADKIKSCINYDTKDMLPTDSGDTKSDFSLGLDNESIDPINNKFNINFIDVVSKNYAESEIENIWYNDIDEDDDIPKMNKKDLESLIKFLLTDYWKNDPESSFVFNPDNNTISIGDLGGFDDGSSHFKSQLPKFMHKYCEDNFFSGLWYGHGMKIDCDTNGNILNSTIVE